MMGAHWLTTLLNGMVDGAGLYYRSQLLMTAHAIANQVCVSLVLGSEV